MGAPEAGWLPPPDIGQLNGGAAGLVARKNHGVATGQLLPTSVDGRAPISQHELRQQRQPSKSSTEAPDGPTGQNMGVLKPAAGGAVEAGRPAPAPRTGLHSTQHHHDGLHYSSKLKQKPASDLKQPFMNNEQRLFGLGFSSPSSLEQSHGVRASSQLTPTDSGTVRSGHVPIGTFLCKTKSLPKNVKERTDSLSERPGRSVRSDSAPLRGSISLGSKLHGRPMDAAPGPFQPQPASTSSKAALRAKSQPDKDAAHRLSEKTNAAQAPKKRPAGAQPAGAVPSGGKLPTGGTGSVDVAPAGKKHGASAKILVPLADDEQPGGFVDHSGRHAPLKHGIVHAATPIQAPAGKAAQHGVRANGFHARPTQA